MQFGNVSAFPFLIDISLLSNGLYILKMTNEEGETESVKFLKISE
jgi:hypothetical protein